MDARASGREHLLLDAADRQHPARQRDLAGHRQVGADRTARQRRRQRRHHRDARRRAVLRDRAGRHVQVDLGVLVERADRRRSATRCARNHDSAIRADSFITSPSWPVSVSWLPPAMRDASTNRTSPPTGVHARPIATPGSLRPVLHLLVEMPRRAEQVLDDGARDDDRRPCRLRRAGARSCGRWRRSRARGCARRPRACSRE